MALNLRHKQTGKFFYIPSQISVMQFWFPVDAQFLGSFIPGFSFILLLDVQSA